MSFVATFLLIDVCDRLRMSNPIAIVIPKERPVYSRQNQLVLNCSKNSFKSLVKAQGKANSVVPQAMIERYVTSQHLFGNLQS